MRNYHNKNKDNEEYKQKKRELSKQYYNNNRDRVISRVMNNHNHKIALNILDSTESSED